MTVITLPRIHRHRYYTETKLSAEKAFQRIYLDGTMNTLLLHLTTDQFYTELKIGWIGSE